MTFIAAVQPTVLPVVTQLDLMNSLLLAVGVIVAVLAVIVALAVGGIIVGAKWYVEKLAKAVAEREHSAPIARVLNSIAFLEWARIRSVGPSENNILYLAHDALEVLEQVDNPSADVLDLLATIKSNLAYYYVDFKRKEYWERALKYSSDALNHFKQVQGEEKQRRALQWLDTYAYVHAKLLTCDQINGIRLRQTIKTWMECYEPIRDQLAEHLALINERCPEQMTPGTAGKAR